MTRLLQFCLCLPLMWCAAAPSLAQAERPKAEVSVRRVLVDNHHLYQVDASGTVLASPAAVWKILTDYEKMPEFVPDLASCKVLARNGNEVTVEQFGSAHLLFFSKAIHLVVRVTETPIGSIDIALVSGNMKHYEARWELIPVPATGGTRVVYSGTLMPDFYVPSLFGAKMIGSDIGHMMNAVLARLEQQHG